MANNKQIWQKCANFSLKFGVLIVGEIEWQFFDRCFAPAPYCLAKKVW